MAGPDAEAAAFTESVSFDWRLWRQDIRGSIAHATMLQKAGLISAQERKEIVAALEEIHSEIEAGKFRWKAALEDVHMNIEAELTRRVSAGAKLHTGRSRNDQVALDLRLWLRDAIGALDGELRRVQRSLLDLAEANASVLMPGYTHLQRAQPIYAAHHFLAYIEMIERDRERAQQCRERVNICPLGSGALAGSSLPLDRELVARLLGFVDAKGRARIAQNSMDAVGDRDFAIEFCGAASLAAMHFSRLAEDLILWATSEFAFARIADAYTTGSSLMPQKKNPDVAELARGKTARVYGDLMRLLTLMKGLPLAYNRDLQEDKEALFDAVDTIRATARVMAGLLKNTTLDPDRCREAAGDPTLLATDLAEFLVKKGVPFRQAHHAVGAAVARAEQLRKPLNELAVAELKSIDSHFDDDARSVFNLEQALNQRNLAGAPGQRQIRKQLARWKKILGA